MSYDTRQNRMKLSIWQLHSIAMESMRFMLSVYRVGTSKLPYISISYFWVCTCCAIYHFLLPCPFAVFMFERYSKRMIRQTWRHSIHTLGQDQSPKPLFFMFVNIIARDWSITSHLRFIRFYSFKIGKFWRSKLDSGEKCYGNTSLCWRIRKWRLKDHWH